MVRKGTEYVRVEIDRNLARDLSRVARVRGVGRRRLIGDLLRAAVALEVVDLEQRAAALAAGWRGRRSSRR